MNVILGISASAGIGIGNAFVIPEIQERVIPKTKISPEDIDEGWSKFADACELVQKQIEHDFKTLPKDSLQQTILETYQLMLTDPIFLAEVKEKSEDLAGKAKEKFESLKEKKEEDKKDA